MKYIYYLFCLYSKIKFNSIFKWLDNIKEPLLRLFIICQSEHFTSLLGCRTLSHLATYYYNIIYLKRGGEGGECTQFLHYCKLPCRRYTLLSSQVHLHFHCQVSQVHLHYRNGWLEAQNLFHRSWEKQYKVRSINNQHRQDSGPFL